MSDPTTYGDDGSTSPRPETRECKSAWQDGALTLYWRAAEAPDDDLRTALRVLDAGGNLLWEWKRSPGAGRFSTDRWPAGRIVADAYRVPADALARAAGVEVAVRPFPEGPFLAPAGESGDFLSRPLPPSAALAQGKAAP